ncbi:hypothetical protein F5Y13DRAFT_202880 [Hypoxylon sp. FL1857]|nr:hypothetical protein F5Y13DRAFT_202880 [Hypoxylon sp. FL1857]
MLPFYFGDIDEAGEDTDMPAASSDETMLCSSGTCPVSLCWCSGSNLLPDPEEVDHSTVPIADLNEQLREARDQIESLEEEASSNSEIAERTIDVMLQRIWRLREILTQTEEQRDSEAAKHKQASETVQVLVNTLSGSKSDSECQVPGHERLATALEESRKAVAEAIQSAEEQSRELSSLRHDLVVANKRVSDERNLSHVVSQQVEGMEHILNIQHSEIKEKKAIIAELRQVIKVLQARNEALLAQVPSARTTSYVDRGIGGEVPETKSEQIIEPERKITEAEEEKVSSQIQPREKWDVEIVVSDNTSPRDQTATVLSSTDQFEQSTAAAKKSLPEWMLYMRQKQASQDPQAHHPTAPTSNLANGHMWSRAKLPVNCQSQTTLSLEDQVEDLKKKIRDLEEELQELQGLGAKLTGFHPLTRVAANTPHCASQGQKPLPEPVVAASPSAALTSFPPLMRVKTHASLPEPPPATPAAIKSSLLHVPEGYEEIPELRLPSPITSIRSQRKSKSQTELRLSFTREG